LGAITDDRQKALGVRVLEVIPGGPAANAGLKRNDLIVRVGEQPIRDMSDLGEIIVESPPGTRLVFHVKRDAALDGSGDEAQLEVTLDARPPPERRAFPRFGRIGGESRGSDYPPRRGLLGVRTVPLDAAAQHRFGIPARQGARILEVIPQSPAARGGLAPGDVIVAVDRQPVRSPEELSEHLKSRPTEEPVEVVYYRGARMQKTAVSLAGPAAGAAEQRIEQLEQDVRLLREQVRRLEQRLDEMAADKR